MGGTVLVDMGEGGRVARVAIDNRRKLNTLNSGLVETFIAAFAQLSTATDLRAVVIAGADPRAFVGGADIDEMAAFDPARGRAFITLVHQACAAVRDCPVPVIGRLHGYVLGAGLELAAACDMRVAASDAVFGMPEVRLGVPSVIEAALLPALIGWGHARELLLLGATYPAATMERWGFLERVVAPDALDAAVETWLEALLACGPRAVRQQKRLMRRWEGMTPQQAIEAGIDAFAEAWEGDEPRRMMAEFLAARRRRNGGEAATGGS